MDKQKIYFLDVSPEDKKIILNSFSSAQIFQDKLSEDEIIKNCLDAEILSIFVHTRISKKIIESLPNLKLIITRSVGYDHIDLITANKKNINVCNVPDYGSHVISEFVFALLLSGLRHIEAGDNRVEKEKDFSFTGLKGMALKGKTLGVVGTGKIGRNVTRIASLGFLMNVLAYDAYPNDELAEENHFSYVSLKEVWEKSDIITLHCPLLSETKHIINKKSLSMMKKGVVIVNTSRGGLINTKDLITSLKSGHVSCAFLDVLEHEDNIAIDRDLIKLPNVITTPHVAFYADDSIQKMYESVFETINNYLKGEKLNNKIIGI
jgi:D-lactate dehydrogenase